MIGGLSTEALRTLLTQAGPHTRVHLIGIGGCGMSGLAHLLLDLRCQVSGSDLSSNSETEQLAARGATVSLGHRVEHVWRARPDLVVYSSAVRQDNPEVQAALELRCPLVRRAVLLSALLSWGRGVCVAGMHGKTTTTALLSFALEQLGANPSYAIGAAVPQLPRHARLILPAALPAPERPWFVIEADESDGTLREFHPERAIVLNVDAEHLDYFKDLQAVCREFVSFGSQIREVPIYCADDTRLRQIFAAHPRAVSFGFSHEAQYRIEREAAADPAGGEVLNWTTRFRIVQGGATLGAFEIALLGEKNVSNAAAVIAFLHQAGYAPAAIAAAIAPFRGAARRQQCLFEDETCQVFDDYGHHPNEIRATLAAFKARAAGRLLVAFQPHRFSRTFHLLHEFAICFAAADHLWLTDIYAASEPAIPGVTGELLADAVRAHQPGVAYVPEATDLIGEVQRALRPGDLVLFLGAGNITRVAHALADWCRQQRSGSKKAPDAGTALHPSPGAGTIAGSGSLQITHEFECELRALISPETLFRRKEPMAKRTTLRVGGPADFYIEPASESELAAILAYCSQRGLPFLLLGRGSNLLVRDGGVRGVVICLGHPAFSQVTVRGEHLHAGAGAKLKAISMEARRHGLSGLEFLEGIPGSLGGAMRMNAGAMGSWLFDVIETIRFMDYNGETEERPAREISVEYRGCPWFKNHIALAATLRGQPADREAIDARMGAFSRKRWQSQPAQPSAGCIFKNPATIPAGKLIDELGLKGARCGGAVVSNVHANFIVNQGNATAHDVLELIALIREAARQKRGIELETEVEIIGEPV